MQQFNTAKFCRDCGSAMVLAAVEGGERKQCTACGQIEWEPPVPVAAVLVPAGRNRDGIVLVQRNLPPVGKWCLPAGFLSTGESPSQAACRETLEEAGLVVTVNEVPDRIMVPPGRNQVLNFYLARTRKGRMQAGSDAQQVKIFYEDNLPEIAFSMHTAFISEYFKERKKSRVSRSRRKK